MGSIVLDAPNRYYLRKPANPAHKRFAESALLLDENWLLFEQNNKSNFRKSVMLTKVGEAKVMSYDDIVEAQAKRGAKEVAVLEGSAKESVKRSAKVLHLRRRLRRGCRRARWKGL